MAVFEDHDYDSVSQAVTKAELNTSVEIIVAISEESGSYRDVDYLVGLLLAFLALCFIVFNPWILHAPTALPLELLFFFGLGSLLSAYVPAIRANFSSRHRRYEQARDKASAVFYNEGIAKTRAGTGLLFFYSCFENQVFILPDKGIPHQISPEIWNKAVFQAQEEFQRKAANQAMLTALQIIGTCCADHLPSTDDNPDEIPNYPRIL